MVRKLLRILQRMVARVPSRSLLWVAGDFNAHLGRIEGAPQSSSFLAHFRTRNKISTEAF